MSGEPPPQRVGVCLSGGGFRAALYGLGVMRYLAEAGAIARVEVVCGVSGGSIAAAAFASAVVRAGARVLTADGFDNEVLAPFTTTVIGGDLRNQALARWALRRVRPGAWPRKIVLADVLAAALFPAVDRLSELPSRPQVVLTATELAIGRAFRFSRDFIGSWDFGYGVPPAELRTATAVAASAAAPPWLPALQLSTAGLGLKDPPAVLTLTDGGVYDNLGVEWFQGWTPERRPEAAVPAEDLVIVNASGRLRPLSGPVRGWPALNRSRQVQYAQTQATRIRWLVEKLERGDQRGAYLGIVADPRHYRLPDGTHIDPSCYEGALPSVLVPPLAALRTDVNRFSEVEAGLLTYHGYWSAHARFASLRPTEAVNSPRWREYAGMSDVDARRLAVELGGRRHRRGYDEPIH
jgi:NTE family protein